MPEKNSAVIYATCFMLLLFAGVMTPCKSYAMPAEPVVHELKQPDGTVFRARQWGNEWSHGWETEEGHTIVFSEALKSWTYAEEGTDGKLKSSSRAVTGEAPPAGIKKRLRPSSSAISNLPKRASAWGSYAVQPRKVVAATGTGKIPVILINFSNTTTAYSASDFNTLLFGTGNYSMKDYYEEVSYNAFSVSGSVSNWVTAAHTHDYYGQNDAQGSDSLPGTLVREAVAALDATNFDFAPYDTDGDCYVDLVNIIHQGTGEESSGNSSDIWSHQWNLTDAYYYGQSDGGEYTTKTKCQAGGYIKVNKYVIEPETHNGQLMTVGVFAHEYGHAFGLLDLYDTDYSSEGIGKWSIMAAGSWNKVTQYGDRPSHMDAWSKYYLGWVTPTAVTETLTNEAINQSATSSDVYKLLTGTPTSGEYFLVENRQKTGFDAGLPGAGLLIWHIDGSVISSQMDANTVNDKECHSSMSPSCATNHYGISLVQADNLWELENNLNSGDSGDAYSSSTNNSFTDTSAPDSKLYNGSLSNVSITNISAPGATMTATLSVAATQIGGTTQSNNCTAFGPPAPVMHVPIVTYSGTDYWNNFWVDFVYNGNGTFIAVNAGIVNDVSPYSNCAASTMTSDLKLHIPVVMVSGVSYWADLWYDGYVFVITGGGQN